MRTTSAGAWRSSRPACRTIDNCYNENSSLILGTKGRCDLLRLRIEGETNWQHPGPQGKDNAYDLEHLALFRAIRAGKPVNCRDYMVRSTLITLMGQSSCSSGKPGPDGSYPVFFTPGVSKLL